MECFNEMIPTRAHTCLKVRDSNNNNNNNNSNNNSNNNNNNSNNNSNNNHNREEPTETITMGFFACYVHRFSEWGAASSARTPRRMIPTCGLCEAFEWDDGLTLCWWAFGLMKYGVCNMCTWFEWITLTCRPCQRHFPLKNLVGSALNKTDPGSGVPRNWTSPTV